MKKPVVLQLVPMLPETEGALEQAYEVVRLPPPGVPEREAMLAAHGDRIRAAVTFGTTGIDPALVERLPRLEIVAINGVGYDRIDLEQARARGIRITNTPDVLTDDVADLAIALLLNVKRRLPEVENHVRAGRWPDGAPALARRASGLRYGIVGMGRIGRAIARRLAGFGGTIAYTGPRRKDVPHDYHEELVALAHASDVLFIAAPASPATRHLVDRAVIDALGREGVLVNIARGAVVDEDALIEALADGRLGGAGLDVFRDEPHVPETLRHLPNVALAPHVGSATHETRRAMGRRMLENLAAHFAGSAPPDPVV